MSVFGNSESPPALYVKVKPPESVGVMTETAESELHLPPKPEPYLAPPAARYDVVMENNFLHEKQKKDEEQPSRLSSILENFCNSTSMHGCGQISGAKLTSARIVWSLLTIGAVGGLMFHLYSIFFSYYKWPIQTKVSLGFNNLKYPAITFCNLNKIKQSELIHGQSEEMERLRQLAELIDPDAMLVKIQNETGVQSTDYPSNISTIPPSPAGMGNFTRMYEDIDLTSFESDVYIAGVNRTAADDWGTDMDTFFLVEEVFDTLYFSINRDFDMAVFQDDRGSWFGQQGSLALTARKTRAMAGHDISEMLISCTFHGRKCFAENFTLYQTSSDGNCWRLSSPKMVAKLPGAKAGLSVILYLQTDEFIPGLTNGYGIKMLIHDAGIKPLPQDEGIFIPSATESNIGIVQKTITRLGDPYGECDDGKLFREKFGFEYSRKTCQVACAITAIYDECGCYGSYYEEIALMVDRDAKPCNTTNEMICMNEVTWNIQEKTTICQCDNPCNELKYDMSVSSRQWPTESFANVLLEGVCEKDPTNCRRMRSKASNPRDLSNNFVKLNIFYETLNFEMITEEPLTDVYNFLASIGGALGLWIGLSMLSFCEIMQLIGDVLRYILDRCRHTENFNNRVKT